MDDAAALAHVPEGFLGGDEDTGDVHGEDALEVLECDVLRGSEHTDPGIVDQDIDLSERAGHLPNGRAHGVRVACIGRQG
ncbi:hypothetical protein D9M71_531400 [compost metagenome]